MSGTGQGDGKAFDATVDAVDNPAGGDPGPYRAELHEQLRAVAEHAALSVELAEQQIADLQAAMDDRRAHAQDAADELRAYEDLHDVHESNRRTTPQE